MFYMLYLNLFLLIFFVNSVHSNKINKNALRIVGGRNASENEFPYVTRLMEQTLNDSQVYKFFCSSVVLTTTWTLTAAHCIDAVQVFKVGKVVIEYYTNQKTEPAFSTVLSMISYPNFVTGTQFANDIGLLNTEPVIIAQYGKLSSLEHTTLIGQEVTLVGFGLMDDLKYPVRVPQVLVVVVTRCANFIQYPEICFAPQCGSNKNTLRSFCSGDSGSPALHTSGIIGINVLGSDPDCIKDIEGDRRFRYDSGYNAGIATPVSPFLDWITTTMKLEAV